MSPQKSLYSVPPLGLLCRKKDLIRVCFSFSRTIKFKPFIISLSKLKPFPIK